MSKPVYQYMQGYSPMGGKTFHFWVDCTKEIYEEEKQEGGTVRVLYEQADGITFTLLLSEPYHDGHGETWTNHEELLKAVEKENGRIEHPTGEESSGQFDSLITGTAPSDW